MVGSVTSAGWGYRVGQNLAMGFVEPGEAEIGRALQVEIIGEARPAKVCESCLYDPENRRVRA